MLTRTDLTTLHETAVACDAKPPWDGFLRVAVRRRFRRGRKDLAQTIITFRVRYAMASPGCNTTRELVGGEDFNLVDLIVDHPRRLDDPDPKRRESPGWLRVEITRTQKFHSTRARYYQVDIPTPIAHNSPWSYYPPARDVIGEPRYADWGLE